MANPSTSSSLVRRPSDDVALMPPPPLKRIKRPPKVLDEDDYTSALSDIIARDYFPGLRESEAQQEYLTALESNNEAWIADAAHKLRQTVTPQRDQKRRMSRDESFNHTSDAKRHGESASRAADTPRGYDGSETPTAAVEAPLEERPSHKSELDTSNMSLSAFQSMYTSEDNESFNTVLDKQNQKRREKHAYLWTEDQRIPSVRQIAHRARGPLIESAENEAKSGNDGKALIPIMAGATGARPARPDAWKVKRPDNTFMFFASSVDEDDLPTTQDLRDAALRAGLKQVVHENTRFPPLQYLEEGPTGQIPSSPSLNTDIIARRDAARGGRSGSELVTEYPGGETPRVSGYAFVDEEDPSEAPGQLSKNAGPSYRDLLAGQVEDSTPNPFQISSMQRREDLHHRMVENTARKKRDKEKETSKRRAFATPRNNSGNMTPAARKLMEKLGRTPVNVPAEGMSSRDMWTPQQTPRRKVVN